jgi:hypothetical protein
MKKSYDVKKGKIEKSSKIVKDKKMKDKKMKACK